MGVIRIDDETEQQLNELRISKETYDDPKQRPSIDAVVRKLLRNTQELTKIKHEMRLVEQSAMSEIDRPTKTKKSSHKRL